MNTTPAEYISNLYKWLSLTNNCFVSGAFVIEDNDEKLYDLLKTKESAFFGLTHGVFKKGRFKYNDGITGMQHDRYILSKDEKSNEIFNTTDNECSRECNSLAENGKIFCLQCKNMDGTVQKNREGKSLQECKGIIKFYQFKLDPDNKDNTDKEWKGKKFVYLKLEKFRTIKPKEIAKHWKEKRLRTKAEKEGNERKVQPIRREDCSKCSGKTIYEHDTGIGKWYGCCNVDECKSVIDTTNEWNENYRVGDEFFISEIISNKFMEKVNQNKTCGNKNLKRMPSVFIHNTGDRSVKLPSNTGSGSRKVSRNKSRKQSRNKSRKQSRNKSRKKY